jgi:hypothetical protein
MRYAGSTGENHFTAVPTALYGAVLLRSCDFHGVARKKALRSKSFRNSTRDESTTGNA